MTAPRIAVVGRTNVGKSTLVNRLAGRREAIAEATPGVTRDRVEVPVDWSGRRVVLVDTGGYIPRPKGLEESVVRQAQVATDTADLILFVVDATTGITDEDEVLASALRRSPKPILVVANKVDSESQEALAAEFYGLGLGEPVSVSALHGRSSGDLLDRLLELLPSNGEAQLEEETRSCIVGRPNVGKSSLFNRLVEEERAVVHDQPGTTRDAVDSIVEVDGRRLRFVDTAGLRREVKTKGLEYYGLVRSLRAIDSSDVAVLVVDASEGVTNEDRRIGTQVMDAGRGVVAVLNKWDLVPSEERSETFEELKRELKLFPGTPVLRTSAKTGMGVGRVIPAVFAVEGEWRRRISTADVNRVLQDAVAAYPPPRGSGRIRYGTQVRAAPPTFILFGGKPSNPTYRKYLENKIRGEFGFAGVPIRLSFRTAEGRRVGTRSRSATR
ncbi:MAG TPA: ribosome biogenesis GTPase Der, partial [Actinomycetota bacterium]|nr:ribosome biogenesis GTPase Der [Actinomycetota bacterium]